MAFVQFYSFTGNYSDTIHPKFDPDQKSNVTGFFLLINTQTKKNDQKFKSIGFRVIKQSEQVEKVLN